MLTFIGAPGLRQALPLAADSAHAAGLSEHRFHRGKCIYHVAGRVRRQDGHPCVRARTDHDRIWVVKKTANNNLDPLDLEELKGVIGASDLQVMREYVHGRIQGSLLVGGG